MIIQEVTMAAPDKICVEVRDSAIVKGGLVSNNGASLGAAGGWQNLTIGAKTDWCYVVGPNNSYAKFQDPIPASQLADKAGAGNPANYSTIAGLTVTAVDRKTIPYDYGFYRSGANPGARSSSTAFKHFIFLTLSGPLPQGGPYTIHNSAGSIPDATFTFDDKSTRAIGIHANQNGHRHGDVSKLAYLSLWTPSPTSEGAIDFIGTYGLTTFEIIDASGWVWYRGPLTVKLNARDVEPQCGFDNTARPIQKYGSGDAVTTGGGKQRLYVSTKVPKVATAVTNANPCQITCVGHGYSTGDVKWLRGFGKGAAALMTGNINGVSTITVIDADNFTIPVDTTSAGTWAAGTCLSGYDSLIYDTAWGNRFRTNVYGIDYSAWLPAKSGTYRIRIPGLGVSDPFVIDESIWYQGAKTICGGFYNSCNGLAKDGRFGYTTPAPFVDGQNGVQVFKSKFTSLFSGQAGAAAAGTLTTPANWNSTTTYAATNIIAGSDNNLYQSVGSGNLNHNPVGDGGVHWTLLFSDPSNTDNASRAPWITTHRATGWYGGFFDAGDWDQYIFPHFWITADLLQFGYQELHAKFPGAANTAFGFPKSSTTLDPTIYTPATDALPDVVHQATWVFDTYRRTQNFGDSIFPDGSVPSGFSIVGGEVGNALEPSWLCQNATNVNAPDHYNNYIAAMGFAKLAKVYSDAGCAAAGAAFTSAAIAAYAWAETIYQSHISASTTVEDAYYATTLGLADTCFSAPYPGGYKYLLANLHVVVKPARQAAAAALYRLTGTAKYQWVTENINLPLTGSLGAAGIVLGVTITYGQNSAGVGSPSSKVTSFTTASTDHATNMRAWAAYLNSQAPLNGSSQPIWQASCSIDTDTGTHLTDCRTMVLEVTDAAAAFLVGSNFAATGVTKNPPAYTMLALGGAPGLSTKWDYLRGNPSSSLVASIKTEAVQGITSNSAGITNYQALAPKGAQNYGSINGNSMNPSGFAVNSYYTALIQAYILDVESNLGQASTYLRLIQDGEGHELGANQYGACCVMGLGQTSRNIQTILHSDGKATGVRGVPGISAYTRDIFWLTTDLFEFGTQTSGTSTFRTIDTPTAVDSTDFQHLKVIDPYRYMFPYIEITFETIGIITQMEFTVEETVIPRQLMHMWLHAHDGNTAQVLDTGHVYSGFRL